MNSTPIKTLHILRYKYPPLATAHPTLPPTLKSHSRQNLIRIIRRIRIEIIPASDPDSLLAEAIVLRIQLDDANADVRDPVEVIDGEVAPWKAVARAGGAGG